METELSLQYPDHLTWTKFKPVLNLGVMASGEGSNFAAILDAINVNNLSAKVSILVVNNPYCGAKSKADELGIPCIVHNHRDFDTRESLDRQLVRTFKHFQVEGIVMAGWMRVVTSVIIDEYANRIINIHPSLLPSFRGIDAIKQSLDAGVKITGCTVHFVEEGVDSGQLIAQAAVPVKESDSIDSLRRRIQEQEHIILPKAIASAGIGWREFSAIMDNK